MAIVNNGKTNGVTHGQLCSSAYTEPLGLRCSVCGESSLDIYWIGLQILNAPAPSLGVAEKYCVLLRNALVMRQSQVLG